jgi:hypothetical protein
MDSDPAVRQAIREELQRNSTPIDTAGSFADADVLIAASAVAIARSKYHGKPPYASVARPTRSDTKHAAIAIETALRTLAARVSDHASPELIAAYLEDTAETIVKEWLA